MQTDSLGLNTGLASAYLVAKRSNATENTQPVNIKNTQQVLQIFKGEQIHLSSKCGCAGCSNQRAIIPINNQQDSSSNPVSTASQSLRFYFRSSGGLPGTSGGGTGDSGDSNVDALIQARWAISGQTSPTKTGTLIIRPGQSIPGDGAELSDNGLISLSAASSTKITLTYNFKDTVWDSPDFDNSQDNNGYQDITSSLQKQAIKSALAFVSSITNLRFKEVRGSTSAHINFGNNDQTNISAGYAWSPSGGSLTQTAVLMNTDVRGGNGDFSKGTYGWHALIHEIGHALGLKHPADVNAGGGGALGPYVPDNINDNRYTIMSYEDTVGLNQPYAQSFMLGDIAALQYMYGVNLTGSTAISGKFTFGNDNYHETIYSRKGTETIDLRGTSAENIVDLNDGTYSTINGQENNIGIAYGSKINNVILSTDDAIDDLVTLNTAFNDRRFNKINNLTSGDKIRIDQSIYGQSLSTDNITIGSGIRSASTADQKIIVDTRSKTIYYDADGNGNGHTAKKIAVYTTASSFSITNSLFEFIA